MGDDKKIDGIKKYDSEDLRKAREIVLKSIGEKGSKKKDEPEISSKELEAIEKNTAQIEKLKDKSKKKIDSVLEAKAQDKKNQVKMAIDQEIEDKQADVTKLAASKLPDQSAKQADRQDQQPDASTDKLASDQKKEKKKVKKTKTKDLKSKKEKSKAKKSKKKAKAKKKININKYLLLTLKIFYYSLLIFLIALLIIYIAFFVLVYSFDLDNKISRKVAHYLPIPALISSVGIVEYYDYKDAENELKQFYNQHVQEMPSQQIISEQIKAKLIKQIVVKNLAEEYEIKFFDYQAAKRELEKRIAQDREIKHTVLMGANKLKQMLESGENFYLVARRYGDDFNLGAYYTQDEAKEKFKDNILDLEASQVSNAITTEKGYYIVQCNGKRNNLISLSYIFIKAKSLEDYAREIMLDLKVRSFVG